MAKALLLMVTPSTARPRAFTYLERTQTTPYLGKQSQNHWEILKIIKKLYCHRGHGAISRHRAHDVYLSDPSAGREVIQWN